MAERRVLTDGMWTRLEPWRLTALRVGLTWPNDWTSGLTAVL